MPVPVLIKNIGTPEQFSQTISQLRQISQMAPGDSTVTVDLGNSIKYVNDLIIGMGFILYLDKSKLCIQDYTFWQVDIIDVFKERIPDLKIERKTL